MESLERKRFIWDEVFDSIELITYMIDGWALEGGGEFCPADIAWWRERSLATESMLLLHLLFSYRLVIVWKKFEGRKLGFADFQVC